MKCFLKDLLWVATNTFITREHQVHWNDTFTSCDQKFISFSLPCPYPCMACAIGTQKILFRNIVMMIMSLSNSDEV